MRIGEQLLFATAISFAIFVGLAHTQKWSLANGAISRDKYARQQLRAIGKAPPEPPKPGFFGTVVQLLWDQVNDTKSAYQQISSVLSDSFVDENAPTQAPVAGSTPKMKISRQELLRVLERNLRGLNRLRALEWRESIKDSQKNIREYKQQFSRGKNLITAN